jgi:hypothetical protein
MSEPTQELIVSELRRRVRVSIAELMQVLGVQFASVLPQEIQRMKASGVVVYSASGGSQLKQPNCRCPGGRVSGGACTKKACVHATRCACVANVIKCAV